MMREGRNWCPVVWKQLIAAIFSQRPTDCSLLGVLTHWRNPTFFALCMSYFPTTSPTCVLCDTEERDTYQHCFFNCISNREAANSMLQWVKSYDSDLNAVRCLRLDIRADVPFTLPTIMVLATGLSLIWANRKLKKVTTVWAMRAELEARVQLLRRTRRIREAGNILCTMIENFDN